MADLGLSQTVIGGNRRNGDSPPGNGSHAEVSILGPRVILLSGRFQVRGSCAYTLRLARHLPAYGITPVVVCPNARSVESKQRSDLKIREYAYLDYPVCNRVILPRVRYDLGSAIPELIHLQSRRVLKQGKWLARRLKRPYVLTVHDYLSDKEKVRLDDPLCAQVITVSESVK